MLWMITFKLLLLLLLLLLLAGHTGRISVTSMQLTSCWTQLSSSLAQITGK